MNPAAALNTVQKVFDSSYTAFLAAFMLAAGTTNTITIKLQDMILAKGLGPYPPKYFEHPFTQTMFMFTGELVCLLVYYLVASVTFAIKFAAKGGKIEKKETNTPAKKRINPILFWLPAICDIGATGIKNVGQIYTQASVCQMLRGLVVVFVGIMSVIFLKRKLYPHHWLGIGCILTGTCCVGLSSYLFGSNHAAARSPLLGNTLVIIAQIIAASQYVVEELFVKRFQPSSLEVVGFEGFFGVCMCACLLFVFYWIPGKDYGSLESLPNATMQMLTNPSIVVVTVISIFSIAFFNFFGMQITKRLNSAARTTIDATRTFFVWFVGMCLGWEHFEWLQFLGFMFLVLGTFTHNEIIKIPYYSQWALAQRKKVEAEKKRKLEEQEAEKTEKKRLSLNNDQL